MTAVHLFDVLARENCGPSAGKAKSDPRLADLAVKLVASSLADLERVREYEQQFALGKVDDPALDLQLLRSVWQLYRDWVDEAEQVLERAQFFRGSGVRVDDVDRLDDAIGRVLARLSLTPEQVAKAKGQARQGQFVPAKELRDELHARLRA